LGAMDEGCAIKSAHGREASALKAPPGPRSEMSPRSRHGVYMTAVGANVNSQHRRPRYDERWEVKHASRAEDNPLRGGRRRGLREVDRLWESRIGTPQGDRLDMPIDLIEVYEDEHYPMGQAGQHDRNLPGAAGSDQAKE
jgi:hypothetical protein